jgi:Cu/Ag efflux protein CusF
MARSLTGAVTGLLLSAAVLLAQDDIQRGKIKKVDADRGTLTITVGTTDREFVVTGETRIVGADNKPSPRGIKDEGLKAGAEVMFKAVQQDGKNVLVGLRLGAARAGGGIRQATVKKIDLDKRVLTLTVGGKDQDFTITEKTMVLDAQGKDLQERFAGLKAGVAVMFKSVTQDGREVLIGVRRADGPAPGQPPLVKVDTSKFKPLTELGSEKYQGYEGGLYPGGKNERPAAHEAAGLALARQVRPLDRDGKPSADGRIVLLSVGMSNTSQASQGFQKALASCDEKNPRLLFVNGAVGGMTAAAIQDPNDGGRGAKYWATVDQRLQDAGVTRSQVQAVWIKEADAGPRQGFPGYAQQLQAELTRIVQLLPARFPNLKLVYLSSRTYGGYARSALNPEPYAFESGLSVRWLIEQQLKGDAALNYDAKKGPVRAPWLSWGPYLWANGASKRVADGFSYAESDFAADGTHLSASGIEKVGRLMLQFFTTDSTSRPWFVRPGTAPGR